jgi:hypothetical protein
MMTGKWVTEKGSQGERDDKKMDDTKWRFLTA